jgi:hypothetical protein
MPEVSDYMDRLHKRAEKAKNTATLHHTALREAYLWYMPERYHEMNADGKEGNAARSTHDHIFDDVGEQALEDGANQIAEALHPWDQVWARWVPRTDIEQENAGDIEKLAELVTKKVTSLLNRSNFDSAAPASHREFLLGTAFLLIARDEDDMSRVKFTALPAYQWAIEANASGKITGMFRNYKIKARDALAELPLGKFSPDTMSKMEGDPDAEVELCMALTYITGELPPLSPRWTTCYYETALKHEVWKQQSRTCPVTVYRASTTAGIAWSRGPGLKALANVKLVNRLIELRLRAAAIDVVGIWQADDDGVLNPHNIKLTPGTIIPKSVGSAGLQPIKTGAQYELSDEEVERLHANIRRSFFVTRVDEREMTAEEYRGRKDQQLRDQRVLYGQLKVEFATQVQYRLVDLAIEMGELPAADYARLSQIELTGPLAMDVRGLEVERLKQAAADIFGLFGPELGMAALKPEEVVPYIVTRRYAEIKNFQGEGELKAFGDTVRQMMAQIQAQQMVQDPAKAVGAMAA